MKSPATNIESTQQARTTLNEMLVDLSGDSAETAMSQDLVASYEEITLACLKLIMVNETNSQETIAAIRTAATILRTLKAIRQ